VERSWVMLETCYKYFFHLKMLKIIKFFSNIRCKLFENLSKNHFYIINYIGIHIHLCLCCSECVKSVNLENPFITQINNFLHKCRNFVKRCNPYLNAIQIQTILMTFMSCFYLLWWLITYIYIYIYITYIIYVYAAVNYIHILFQLVNLYTLESLRDLALALYCF
jgi:hypothetical protein